MTSEQLIVKVIDAMEAIGIDYFLSGSFASNFYGLPRATQDAGFVMCLEEARIGHLADQLGDEVAIDRQPTFETVTGTIRYLAKSDRLQVEIELLMLSDDPHDQARFKRRVAIPYPGRKVFLPSHEDVIIAKLRWSSLAKRTKDWDDARNVAAVHNDSLDWAYIEGWCTNHATADILADPRQWLVGMS